MESGTEHLIYIKSGELAKIVNICYANIGQAIGYFVYYYNMNTKLKFPGGAFLDIEQIDFGKDTAEFDKHLSEYFLQTSAYNRVISGYKSIVIGRKGTGKTSILKYCIDNEKGSNNYIVKIEASHSTYVKDE